MIARKTGGWVLVLVLAVSAGTAFGSTRNETTQHPQSAWLKDYSEAYLQAQKQRKMLLLFFDDQAAGDSEREFLRTMPRLAEEVTPGRYLFAHLPLNAQLRVNGIELALAGHEAFRELRGGQGLAIIDLINPKSQQYAHVVTCLPFARGQVYDARTMRLVLTLPDGTLTQRTMVFAVRMHPEAPLSTHGHVHWVLLDEAASHSGYQASIQNQGHHSWDSRFHRINARLDGSVSAKEVCAESWPNYSLLEACFDCVHSWRQSSGHWDAVASSHWYYGYDIKRGHNGIWYATGIFGG